MQWEKEQTGSCANGDWSAIQRTPAQLESSDNSSLAAEAAVITEYNDALAQRVDQFISTKGDVNAWVVDTQQPFNVVLDNPDAFGYANSTCYDDDGVTCPWWNNYHPAMAIHNLVASKFAAVVGSPWSAKQEV